MVWKGRRESENVEDRRGMGGGGLAIGGIGGLILVLAITLLGGDPGQVIGQLQGQSAGKEYKPTAKEEAMKKFVGVILADTEDVWTEQFAKRGQKYEKPKLVLFTGGVQSACGNASAAMGPFYCSLDKTVYIDLSFFNELSDRFGAPGEFAQAYVIAHEVGHHVQNLMGLTDKVHGAQGKVSKREYNQLSVKLELQADFLAGMWAHQASQMAGITQNDIRDGLRAANAIGDDTLQKQGQGEVAPDSLTQCSSEQRVRWFSKGWQTGRFEDGDTFNASQL